MFKFFKKKKEQFKIVKRSNIIQYDEMGYPLRLIIDNSGEQLWIDTVYEKDDLVLVWKE